MEHIAEAAERDGAQVAAHDQALRSAFAGLPSDELHRRREELRLEAGTERESNERHRQISERIAEGTKRIELLAEQAERIGDLPRRERKPELARIEATARLQEEAIERLEAERHELPEVGHGARAKVAVIDHLLAERERTAFLAARISPPDYIVKGLGERPDDPSKRQAWDRAVRGVEGYRQRNGVVDRDHALGARPESRAERAAWESQQRQLRQGQRELGREIAPTRARSLDKGMGIGR